MATRTISQFLIFGHPHAYPSQLAFVLFPLAWSLFPAYIVCAIFLQTYAPLTWTFSVNTNPGEMYFEFGPATQHISLLPIGPTALTFPMPRTIGFLVAWFELVHKSQNNWQQLWFHFFLKTFPPVKRCECNGGWPLHWGWAQNSSNTNDFTMDDPLIPELLSHLIPKVHHKHCPEPSLVTTFPLNNFTMFSSLYLSCGHILSLPTTCTQKRKHQCALRGKHTESGWSNKFDGFVSNAQERYIQHQRGLFVPKHVPAAYVHVSVKQNRRETSRRENWILMGI